MGIFFHCYITIYSRSRGTLSGYIYYKKVVRMNKLELPARILFDTVFLLLRSLAKEQSQKKDLSEGFLSISKGQILFVVAEQTARCGCGIKLKQIAAQTRQSMSTVSETVDFLVNNELLSRKISDKDRRAIEIELTHKGKLFVRRHIEKLARIWQETLVGISQEEQETFFKVLTMLHERLKTLDSASK